MTVSLQKGQKVDLRKSDGTALKRVMVGLGWDEADKSTEAKSGGFFSALFGSNSQDIDCDASAFLCVGGKIQDIDDIVYFGNLEHGSGAVKHMGDNLTGEGEGDDEQIFVNLNDLPPMYDRIIFVVNIYKARERNQHFGMIRNAFIRICDNETGQEMCKYNLSDNYDGMTAMIFGEIYLRNGQWRFNAMGDAVKDNSIQELARRFM